MNWTREQKLTLYIGLLTIFVPIGCGGIGYLINQGIESVKAFYTQEAARKAQEAEAAAQQAAQQAQFDHEQAMATAAEAAKAPRPVRRFRHIINGTAYITIQNVGQQQLSFGYAGVFQILPKMGELPQSKPNNVPTFHIDLSNRPLNEARSIAPKPVIEAGQLLELAIKLPKAVKYPIEVRLYWTEESHIAVDFDHP